MGAGRKAKVALPPGKFRSLFDGSVRSFAEDSEGSAKRQKLLDTGRFAVTKTHGGCNCELCICKSERPLVAVSLSLKYDDDDVDLDDDWLDEPTYRVRIDITRKDSEALASCPSNRRKWNNRYDRTRQVREEWLLLPWVRVIQINGQVCFYFSQAGQGPITQMFGLVGEGHMPELFSRKGRAGDSSNEERCTGQTCYLCRPRC